MGDTKQTRTRQRRGQKGPTVSDVARLAGVSAMTVSRVVNGDARVQDDTRARVLAAVGELGYVPNRAARSLAGGRNVRIALLYANPSAAYLSEFMVGALAAANACDAELVVEHCDEGQPPADLVARLDNHRIDACILPPPLCDAADLVQALVQNGMACVQVATGRPLAIASAVTIDDEAAAHAITSRLISAGHRRIGLVAGNPNQTVSALRQAGAERAFAEAGIAREDLLIVPGDFSYRSGLRAAEELLAASPPPTAIFACNDDMAAACLAVAHRHGLDVPRDLSVCGFDDTAMATTIWPELTTIRQPVARMAERALQLLVQSRRTQAAAPSHERLPFELVVRASDGPPH